MGDGTWGSRYIPPAMRRDEPDNFDLAPPEPLPADPETVLAALDPLLTDARRARIEHVIAARARAVVAVLDGLIDPHNVSAVLRSADAFGVQQVHLIARADPFLASPRVSQGADRWVDVIRHASPRACVSALHALGYKVYVAAMDGALRPEALADAPKVAIVFGNEHAGVSEELRHLADGTYAIPMQGFVQSLNVSVAAAITLFAATRGRPGDLEASERQLLRARYTLLSVPRAGEIVAEYQRRQAR
jgi:tRNA (guanosine-2'-O-)-methyltransferase